MSISNIYCSTESTYETSMRITPNAIIKVRGNRAKLILFSPLSNTLSDKVYNMRMKGKKTEHYEFFFYQRKRHMIGVSIDIHTHKIGVRSHVMRKLTTATNLARDLKRWVERQ